MIISEKVKFFGFYFYDCYYNNKKHKFNILLIGSKNLNDTFILSEFISRIDTEEHINYSYNISDLSQLHETLKEITNKIENPKNKFILISESDISMDKMIDVLEEWKNNIILSNKT